MGSVERTLTALSHYKCLWKKIHFLWSWETAKGISGKRCKKICTLVIMNNFWTCHLRQLTITGADGDDNYNNFTYYITVSSTFLYIYPSSSTKCYQLSTCVRSSSISEI